MTPNQEKVLAQGIMTLLRDVHQRARNETPAGNGDAQRGKRVKVLGENAVRDYKAIGEQFGINEETGK